jgi:acyl-CoA thioesterase II
MDWNPYTAQDPPNFVASEDHRPFAIQGSLEEQLDRANRYRDRASGKLPDAQDLQQAVLAYASDLSLLDAATMPHAVTYFDDRVQIASLDHAMWFHRPFRADEWLLYVCDSPSGSNARGFARGSVYDRGGRLVASVAQEGLIRRRPASGARGNG